MRDDTEHSGALDYDEAKVVINAPPVANAGQDILAGPGDAVRFDGGNSFDIDGSIADWRWDFSDDEEFQLGRDVVRAYTAPGVYTALLTVTDDSGAGNAIAQDEVVIRINHAPVASAGPDIDSGRTTVSFDGSQSADADGDALTYRWDFGDGTPPAGGAQVTHTYATGGAYPVVLTVYDGTALWNATASVAITVVDPHQKMQAPRHQRADHHGGEREAPGDEERHGQVDRRLDALGEERRAELVRAARLAGLADRVRDAADRMLDQIAPAGTEEIADQLQAQAGGEARDGGADVLHREEVEDRLHHDGDDEEHD